MQISIRKFTSDDIRDKIRWINDPEVNRFLHYDLPLEYKKTLDWYERIKDRTDRYDCVIEVDGVSVGLIGLLNISDKNKKAEYYIAIGEGNYRGKSVANAATNSLLKYAFYVLRLESVYTFTESKNIAAQKSFEKFGFINVGLIENDLCYCGRFINRYMYNITKERFLNQRVQTPVNEINDFIGGNRLFIKREDMIPFSFGGNKARKGKLFFKNIELSDNEYNYIVTYGGSHSNHCRIIANLAAQRNIPCIIISPVEVSDETYNSRIMRLFGAEIISVPKNDVHDTIENVLTSLKSKGYCPYFIPGGGHGNIGTQAYVDCYDEIFLYEQNYNVKFDYIFFASGTGTTQSGLVCGKILCNDVPKIVGISIARKLPYGRDVVIDSIKEYFEHIKYECDIEIIEENTIFIDDYIGNGYGKKDKRISELILDIMQKYGIPLDSTYTGKAWCGMEDYLRKYKIEGKNILFIHTGGTPLFFDDIND